MDSTMLHRIMAVAIIGMAVALWLDRQRGNARAKHAAWLLAVIGGGIAFGMLGDQLTGYSEQRLQDRLRAREMQYQQAGHVRFGQYLAATFPGARAVLITALPTDPHPSNQDVLALAALQEGIGKGFAQLTVHNFPPDQAWDGVWDPNAAYPVDPLPSAADWDAVATPPQEPGPDLIISMVGLPLDYTQMKLWQMPAATRPRVALANCPCPASLYGALTQGEVAAVLCTNDQRVYEPKRPFPADLNAAFAERWLLITPANLAAVAQGHPDMFPPECRGMRPFAAAPTSATSTPVAQAPGLVAETDGISSEAASASTPRPQ